MSQNGFGYGGDAQHTKCITYNIAEKKLEHLTCSAGTKPVCQKKLGNYGIEMKYSLNLLNV